MNDTRAGRREDGETGTVEIAVTPRSGGWVVEVQDLEGARSVPLGDTPLVFGSGRSAGVVVSDATVSARHCEIVVVGAGVVIRDLGSTNGTFVGGARVKEAWGAEGATITLGQSTLVISALTEPSDDEEANPLPGLVGGSPIMRRIAAQVRRLARLSAPVLVTGETGVGKELVARALHTEGPRGGGPFVAMNVAALPRELVESELFGHERGAFTGAVARRAGAFTEAEGGTLFLDEIGELPIDAQPKLLRALDGYEVRRVGGGAGRRPSARIVAATHKALLSSVEAGLFRRDLFHRLEVFVVELPPLRERRSDILPIARVMLGRMESEIGRHELTPSAIAVLTAHDWPGNVRELRNVMSRAADLAKGSRWLDAALVERALRKRRARPTADVSPQSAKQWLRKCGGNVSAAARAAGMPRTTFRKLVGA